MSKTYTIEVHPYPQEFIVSANSEAEAKLEANKRFSEVTNGMSVFENKVINVSQSYQGKKDNGTWEQFDWSGAEAQGKSKYH